jgi:hypothetical protein
MGSSRDWMFCPLTGQLLDFDAARNIALCPLSGQEKSLAGGEPYAKWDGNSRIPLLTLQVLSDNL